MATHDRSQRPVPQADSVLSPNETALLLSAFFTLGLAIVSVLTI